MTTSTSASATLFAPRLRGPTLLASGVVTAILAMALLAWIAPPAGVGNSSGLRAGPNGTVGEGQLAAAEQSLNAGQGPGAGTPMQCTSTVSTGSAHCEATGSANPGWGTSESQSISPDLPKARTLASMTYDAKDRYVVLFGGVVKVSSTQVPLNWVNTTWKFANGRWTKLHPATSPPARYGASMTYDAKDGYVVLFGGSNLHSTFGDTWAFVAGDWRQLYPTTSPPARGDASMAYDAKDGYVLLFGGAVCCWGGYMNDTWKFSGGGWTRLTPATAPPIRYGASMTYDSRDGYVVLFGGYAAIPQGIVYRDTWVFTGGVWANLTTTTLPPGGGFVSITYDAKDGYVVLFGGSLAYGLPAVNITWKFVGGLWTNITRTTSPATRWSTTMVYDPRTEYVVLFGGQNSTVIFGDTWKFVGGVWTYLS